MDWQHLIMNGENLAEYAALLAAEGLLGHQHANSGWGRSTTTTWSARRRSWRRSSSRSSCAAPGTAGRRAARLRPLPLHRGRGRRGEALRAAVAVHRRGRGEDRRGRRCARRSRRRTPCARTSWSTPHSVLMALIGLDVGTTGVKGVAIDEDGECSRRPSGSTRSRRRSPGWAEQDPEDWWQAAQACLARLPEGRSGSPGRCTGSSSSTSTGECCGRRSSGTTSAPPPSAPKSRRGSASSG